MRKILLALIVVVAVILSGCKETEQLTYNYDESSMTGDFTIENDEVIIPCIISVSNNTNEEQSFTMTGVFEEDEESSLLQDEKISACSKGNKSKVFYISPNSTEVYQVLFIGKHGGGTQKEDRLPPDEIIFNITD